MKLFQINQKIFTIKIFNAISSINKNLYLKNYKFMPKVIIVFTHTRGLTVRSIATVFNFDLQRWFRYLGKKSLLSCLKSKVSIANRQFLSVIAVLESSEIEDDFDICKKNSYLTICL